MTTTNSTSNATPAQNLPAALATIGQQVQAVTTDLHTATAQLAAFLGRPIETTETTPATTLPAMMQQMQAALTETVQAFQQVAHTVRAFVDPVPTRQAIEAEGWTVADLAAMQRGEHVPEPGTHPDPIPTASVGATLAGGLTHPIAIDTTPEVPVVTTPANEQERPQEATETPASPEAVETVQTLPVTTPVTEATPAAEEKTPTTEVTTPARIGETPAGLPERVEDLELCGGEATSTASNGHVEEGRELATVGATIEEPSSGKRGGRSRARKPRG